MPTTTPTTDPVPSEAPQDLPFNAGAFDEFMNSTDATFEDRLGNTRKTLNGIEADVNADATITLARQWATKTDGPVGDGEYSAKFHAQATAASDASAAGHEAGAAAQADRAETAKAAVYGLVNMGTSFAVAVGYSASTTGPSAYFSVEKGGLGPDGVTPVPFPAIYRRTGISTGVLISYVVDGSAYAFSTDSFALVLKALDKFLLIIGNDGEIYPSRLEGRSVQDVLLELGSLISPKLADPALMTVSAPVSGSPGSSVQLLRWNPDGGIMIPGLGEVSVQDAIAKAQATANAASKLNFDAGTFTLGDSTKATLVRDPSNASYSTGILYVAIPSVSKTGNRLWAAYTANKSVSVNSGEEPGSYCVLRYSDDGGSTWATAMYVAHPNPTVGRTADPTLLVRDGILYLYYFQSGSNIAYDEAISTWQIACTNPQADPTRAIWSEPVRVQYGFFVTTQFRWNERYVIPLVVLPDALASTHVSKQHLNIDRGTHLYQVFGRSMTRIASIPFDLPASNRSWGETSVQPCPDGSLLALIRYADGLYFQRSIDGGKTWGAKSLITTATGIDATTSSKGSLTITDSGRLCLVWNNSAVSTRTAMTIALSSDGGATWPVKQLIDGRDKISYPNVTHDGDAIHVVYDRDRMAVKRIYHTVLSEAALVAGTQTVTLHPVNND